MIIGKKQNFVNKDSETILKDRIAKIKGYLIDIEGFQKRSKETKRAEFETSVKAGQELFECKKLVGHKNWLPWLKKNYPKDPRTASNLMALARKKETVSDLVNDDRITISMLYVLATMDENELNEASEIIHESPGLTVSVGFLRCLKKKVPRNSTTNGSMPHNISGKSIGKENSQETSDTETTKEHGSSDEMNQPHLPTEIIEMITELKENPAESILQVIRRVLLMALDLKRNKCSSTKSTSPVKKTEPTPKKETISNSKLEPTIPKETIKPIKQSKKAKVGYSPAQARKILKAIGNTPGEGQIVVDVGGKPQIIKFGESLSAGNSPIFPQITMEEYLKTEGTPE
ncbi:MAG: DUF3102 domain-containing protein [Candidatus Riflebacteria bacterium]|nr:DUF3102 domain-containing protein [Candidatus Riflebacteria bacterium]